MTNKDLKVNILDHNTRAWQGIYRATLNTVSKDTTREPSSEWKLKILMSEHSPIRKLHIGARFTNLFSWVSVHLVRHKIGIEHFVTTQRTDRTGVDRGSSPQNALVRHEIDVDAQAVINISRKRLCKCASKETTEAWQLFLDTLRPFEPELVSRCVKECVYRNGLCPEFKTCGYNKTEMFKLELEAYTDMVKEQIAPCVNIHINRRRD